METTSSGTHSHHRKNVLDHSILEITGALEQTLFAEEISTREGLFQSLDARVKVISVLALLIGVSLSHSLLVIFGVYLIVLLFAWLSSIPPGFLIKRVWLALPFFTAPIVLPALFITPGPVLWHLPLGIVITHTGLNSMLFLLLRVSTSVSLSLLLVLTTPWNTVLSAMSILHLPDVFVLILGMTYRYIYLLLHIANDMFLSRKSRMVGRLSTGENQHMLAAISGTLLNKSLNMSGEVYLAMQSRGFRGTIVTLKPFQLRWKDRLWLSVFLVITTLVIYYGR